MSKTINNGKWTFARFNSFIKSALRAASQKWPPKHEVLKEARVKRGFYKCAGYKRRAHEVPASLPPAEGNKRRIKNAIVDHIDPVVDPVEGFVNWDTVIARMFCEKDGLQVLCHDCHTKKSADERAIRKENKSE